MGWPCSAERAHEGRATRTNEEQPLRWFIYRCRQVTCRSIGTEVRRVSEVYRKLK